MVPRLLVVAIGVYAGLQISKVKVLDSMPDIHFPNS